MSSGLVVSLPKFSRPWKSGSSEVLRVVAVVEESPAFAVWVPATLVTLTTTSCVRLMSMNPGKLRLGGAHAPAHPTVDTRLVVPGADHTNCGGSRAPAILEEGHPPFGAPVFVVARIDHAGIGNRNAMRLSVQLAKAGPTWGR